MASSRNRRPKPDRAAAAADAQLLAALERSVGAVFEGGALLIAYSGGPDSSALLDLACRLRERRVPAFSDLRAAHVHHGLQACADAWAEHCAQQCRQRGIEWTIARVHVDGTRGRGIEAAARQARYAALVDAARACGARLLLTAHHADDRIETFLLQWLRGAGPSGLAGIAALRGMDDDDPRAVRLLRPLLEITRAQLEAYVERHGLTVVQDPSNADTRLARNAVRRLVVPQLARIRGGFRKSAARSIELVAEAAELLDELAREGLDACTEGAPAGMLRIDRLQALAPARRALVLRAWMNTQGIEAPSRARLREALAQALQPLAGGGKDGRMLVRFGPHQLRRHRGLLSLRVPPTVSRARARVHWRGEPEVAVPGWGGVLRFCAADGDGFDPAWLREQPLEIRARTGGERLKPHPTRPSKRLKQLYQEAGVPEFERAALPLLWRDDRLIFAARIGADARLTEPGRGRVRIEWHGEASLLAE
jgi:tRNA(Ile)-lysidine synthase